MTSSLSMIKDTSKHTDAFLIMTKNTSTINKQQPRISCYIKQEENMSLHYWCNSELLNLSQTDLLVTAINTNVNKQIKNYLHQHLVSIAWWQYSSLGDRNSGYIQHWLCCQIYRKLTQTSRVLVYENKFHSNNI